MRFKPKAKRKTAARRDDVDFDDYEWETEKEPGWHPFVVLNAKEELTKKNKDEMWVIDFGVDLPDGEGGRIRWYVPETFPAKVEMLQSVLLAEYEDEDEDFDLQPKVLMFRTCVGLIEVDENHEREDGETSWQIVKIIRNEEAAEELGADWLEARPAAKKKDADTADTADDDAYDGAADDQGADDQDAF